MYHTCTVRVSGEDHLGITREVCGERPWTCLRRCDLSISPDICISKDFYEVHLGSIIPAFSCIGIY